MGQATQNGRQAKKGPVDGSNDSRLTRIVPALAVAIICTALIAEAVATAVHGRANGDLMVIVCPILGATFLSIPAVRAWWFVISNIRAN